MIDTTDFATVCHVKLRALFKEIDERFLRIRIELPMKIEIKTWEKIGGAVSVKGGPLWYSLEIKENRISVLPFAVK